MCGMEYNLEVVAKFLCLCVFIQYPSPASVPCSDSTVNATQTALLTACPLPNQAPSHFPYGLQWKAHAFSGTEREEICGTFQTSPIWHTALLLGTVQLSVAQWVPVVLSLFIYLF